MQLKSFKIHTTKPWPLVLGVDISYRSMKYLLLRRAAGRGLKVEAYGRYSLESGDIDPSMYLQAEVKSLFRRGKGLKQAKMVLGVDGPELLIKRESFPSLSKKELLQTIQFEIQRELGKEGEVAGFVSDYQVLGPDPETESNVEYLLMGIPEETVHDRVRAFVAESVVPIKATPSVLAVANLLQFIPEADSKKLVGILDIGAQRSMLVLLRDGKMDFFREIVVGGEDFTKAITGTIFHEGRAIQFTTKEAMEFKSRYGYPLKYSEGMSFRGAPLSEVGTMMRPIVERLTGEIQRSIGFYRDQSKGGEVEAIYLIGGGAQLKHLSDVLTDNTGIPVSGLPFPEGLNVSGDKEQQEAFQKKFLEQAMSLSLAMESSLKGNLLPQPYTKIHRASLVQRGLQYGVLGVVALLTMVTYFTHSKLEALRDEVKQVQKRVSVSRNMGPLFNSLQLQQNALKKKIADITIRTQQNEDIIQVIRLISHAVPKNLSLISLEYGKERKKQVTGRRRTQEDIDAPRKWVVRIQGISRNPPNDVGIYVAQFIVELEKSGYFSNVKLEQELFTQEENDYAFKLLGYLNQEAEESVE